MDEKKNNRLIHIVFIQLQGKGEVLLLLRQMSPVHFVWFERDLNGGELETSVQADSIQEALRLAARTWKKDFYNPLKCGFRYTLPERDEHGTNALFYQMAASYSSMNGIYFDEELGNNCFVQNASIQSRDLLKKLQNEGRL